MCLLTALWTCVGVVSLQEVWFDGAVESFGEGRAVLDVQTHVQEGVIRVGCTLALEALHYKGGMRMYNKVQICCPINPSKSRYI